MNILQATILGIIQGLTEFLPISSTAHLKLIPALLGWRDSDGQPFDPGAAFTAVIQWGTWLAAVIYFRRDVGKILAGMWRGVLERQPFGTAEARLGWMMIVATIPVVACGIAFHQAVETWLRSLYVISAAMILLALVLVGAELLVRYRHRRGVPDKTLENFGWAGAIWVGLAQAVALIPGASRSGVTITGGLFVGLSRSEAARFSFLLSLLSVFAAGVHQLYKERVALLGSQEDAINLLVATVVSGIVGYGAMWFLMTYLKTHTLYLFVGYRILLGLLLLALLATGVLAP